MKKVLFVATVTKHINTFHIPYLKWFKEQGYEVHVASNGDEKIEYCDKHYDLPFERFPIKKNNLKTYKELKKIIDDNSYEIVHCHTPVGGVLTRLAARKARKNGTKVIYTAHGLHFYKGAPLLNWIIYYPIEKICARWTDTLITITEEDYKFAKKKLGKAKQIEHVHGVGMNTERFEKDFTFDEKQEIKKRLGIKKEDIVFSYVAELNKNKNQILLIDVIKELKKENFNVKLLLVGEGPLKEQYIEYVKNSNLEDNVKVLGKRKDINEILSITDIYLASSIREGLPVNIMEAMYKGLPVIATDNRGHRELVKNNENGFTIKNKEEVKEKIKELLNNKQLKECFSIKSKEESKKYEIKHIINNVQDIYDKNQKIKVVHLLNSNSYSGAENVVIQIIKKSREKEKIEYVYTSPEGKIGEVLEKNQIRYRNIEKISMREIKKILKEEKPDVIHAHDFKASILTAFANIPINVISHIHKNDPKMKKINIYSIIYLISCLKYSKILFVSEAIEKEFIFRKYIKNKVMIMGNPIDTQKILEKSKSEKKDEKYDILYIGRLSKEKNPLEYIQVVNEVKRINPDIKCAIIGDGPLQEECKRLIKKEQLEDTIELLGFLDNPYTVLKNAKIMCMTSNWEGFGLAAIEALTLGVPVIARNVGGLKNIVDNNCGKLVEHREEYVSSIKELLNNEKLRKEKSENAKEKAKKIENIEEYIENIIQVYRRKCEK